MLVSILACCLFSSAPSSSPVINTQTSKANDAHSIYVDWSEIPEQNRNGKIKGYRVMYKASDEATTKMLNVSYVNTDKTITGLRTFTSYCIKVVGYTDVGDSPPGSCTYIKTGDKGSVQYSMCSETGETSSVQCSMCPKSIIQYGLVSLHKQ